jgi:hypothetical protein
METSQIVEEGEKSQNVGEGGNACFQDEYEILTTPQITSKIIDIIEKAEEYCFVVSPYFDPWIQSKISFEYASNKKKKIIFFFRHNQKKEDIDSIKEFHDKSHFDIVFINNLHAKIYVNENEALITSMNLTDYAQANNHEIGVLIKNKKKLNEIKDIIDKIFRTGKVSNIGNKYYKLLNNNLFFEKEISYCTNCGDPRIKIKNYYYCENCTEKNRKGEISLLTQYCYLCGEKLAKNGDKSVCPRCS